MQLGKAGQRLDSDGVKLYAANAAKEIADSAIQVLGGYGYVGEYNVERLWRDAKLLEIGGGTNESHEKNITKDLAKTKIQLLIKPSSFSAIWIAFNAAPLYKLSLTIQSHTALVLLGSFLRRPTKTGSFPAESKQSDQSLESVKTMPLVFDKRDFISSKSNSFSNKIGPLHYEKIQLNLTAWHEI